MERFPEVRLEPDLARLVDARLAAGMTWASLVREAVEAYLRAGATPPKRRRRRRGPVAAALTVALNAVRFEARDAGAVGLAKSLAERLDTNPADAKYLASRLLAALVELRLTPAARQGILGAAARLEHDDNPHEPGALERLRFLSAARSAGIPGLFAYLSAREGAERYYLQLVSPEARARLLAPERVALIGDIATKLQELAALDLVREGV